MNARLKLPEKRDVSKSLVAPNFVAGTVLEADQLNLAVENGRQMIRLLLRSLLGCGVMCGLVVRPREECSKLHIAVDCGTAVDCCGDLIEVPKTEELVIDLCGVEIKDPLWVVLRRYDKSCAPRTSVCGDEDEERSVCTQVRAGYQIKVVWDKPECACGCEVTDPQPSTPAAGMDVNMRQKAIDAEQDTIAAFNVTSGTSAADFDYASIRPDENKCICTDIPDCHVKHYDGECCCDCATKGCNCEWIVLAQVKMARYDREDQWIADHRYRRFIRPVLMRDPVKIIGPKNQQA